VPAYAKYLEAHRDRHLNKKVLSAVIEWWRTGHSGMLRAVCMDIVALHRRDEIARESHSVSAPAPPELQLEDIEASLPLFEDVVVEILDRELAVRSEAIQELSHVDGPRCRDIMSRLINEISKHVDSEWHIAQTALSSTNSVLPHPQLFQAPNWAPPAPFDLGAPKTAFLGAEIMGRYTVTRYVSRGAMGRVWVVEDKMNLEDLPLCLKTFYCDCECEEMSNLTIREFKRSVLEELSQVERWLTSRTRLASSKHIVRVVRVLRDAPVVRTASGQRVEGMVNAILMEFCDKGELTSYLWNAKTHQPRAFDEQSALYLFAQLIDLLIELLPPAELPSLSSFEQASPLLDVEGGGGGGDSRFSWRITASAPSPTNLQRTTSANTDLSVNEPEGSASFNDEGDRPGPIKYFHNDIKTENLVISGTILKLIDFQSLTPLRSSRMAARPRVEHATPVYQHQHPAAMGKSLEAKAEATALWAVGVILVRLLAAELPTDWVFRHQGMGTQEQLEDVLPEGHCLLSEDEASPRDLLDQIFSPVQTPPILEVLTHPWLRGAREDDVPITGKLSQQLIESAELALKDLRPTGVEPGGARVAWIPLTGCINIEGVGPPLKLVEEIIGVTVSLSDGRFQQSGSRERKCSKRGSVCGISSPVQVGDPEEECFHEWHLTICADDEDEEGSMVPELNLPTSPMSQMSKDQTPATSPVRPTGSGLSPASPITPVSDAALSPYGASPGHKGSRLRVGSMWHALRTRLVVDRFYVQIRIKEDLEEDEPSDIWWLRLKWLPPMVTGKKDTLGSLTHHGARHHYSTCSFVQLQQLLLEGRNDVMQRREREKEREKEARKKKAGMLSLPGIMSR